MDASEILVAVMVAAAVAWLVWAELHTRRNRRASQKQEESAASKSSGKPEARAGSRQVRA
jgi:uncharacterized membrane protein YccC